MIEAVMVRQATKVGTINWKVGGVADLSFPTSNTRRGRVQDGGNVSCTLMAGNQELYKLESEEVENYRIRKLTPRECWRLMGFSDEDFEKAEAVNSNTQLYAQAGNSIVVNVLEAIFGQMINNDPTPENGIQETFKEAAEEKSMDAIKNDIFKLVDKELEAANEKFPLFNSPHEAFAVLLEEVEEAQEEATNLEMLANNYWIGVKENHNTEAMYEEIAAAYEAAINLATEAIQAAAMARKAILSNIDLMALDETMSD